MPHKIMELYEKNKHRLMLGGIGKEEFSRNSEVIMQVLSVEENMEASSRRHSKLKKLDSSIDGSSEDVEISPKEHSDSPKGDHNNNNNSHTSSSRPVNMVDHRDALRNEGKHLTLKELCSPGKDEKIRLFCFVKMCVVDYKMFFDLNMLLLISKCVFRISKCVLIVVHFKICIDLKLFC
jgi:hypothetical protein